MEPRGVHGYYDRSGIRESFVTGATGDEILTNSARLGCLRKVYVCLLVVVLFVSNGRAAEGFTIDRIDEGVARVMEAGEPVFEFQIDPVSQDGKYARANYLHPVYDPDGVLVTEDFPKDHLHHRGIFWAWHQVLLNGRHVSDPWVCKDIKWDKPIAHGVGPSSDSASFSIVRDWLVPDPEQAGRNLRAMREMVGIEVWEKTDGIRRIDIAIGLRALVEGVALGGSDDVKGYGGFSPRIRLSEDVEFVGQTGPVKPAKTAVDGGAWMNVTRTLEGKRRSVTILVHPSHPGFPVKWILRSKRSMQNPQWPGRKPVSVSTKSDTVLRYRLLLHNDLLKPVLIEEEWKHFAGR